MPVDFLCITISWLLSVLSLATGDSEQELLLYEYTWRAFFTSGFTLCIGGIKKSNEENVKPTVVISGGIMLGFLNKDE